MCEVSVLTATCLTLIPYSEDYCFKLFKCLNITVLRCLLYCGLERARDATRYEWFMSPAFLLLCRYSVKRSDVTGNRFEWELGDNKVI